MHETVELSANMEDYLEVIFHITGEKGAARAKDIAQKLNVNNSSVTGALRTLKDKDLINWAPYDVITLTGRGCQLARDIVRRHEALQEFFIKILRVDEKEACEAACRMEHAISRTVLDRLILFTEFIQVCPRGGEDWVEDFWSRCEAGYDWKALYDDCESCVSRCRESVKAKIDRQNRIPEKEIFLTQMQPGQIGKILKIVGRIQVKKRLAGMEIAPGMLVEVKGHDSIKDIVDIKIKGYHISLRSDDAARIEVAVY
jgi:DtxR family Mn-dependent transcriptional regulator